MKAENIIIYTDMDGTLLSDWSLGPYIPEYNLQMLRDFRAGGGLFSAASGRQYRDIEAFFPQGIISAPIVCANGAAVYDSGSRSFILKSPVPMEYCLEALEFCRKNRGRVSLAASDTEYVYNVAADGDESAADGLYRRPMSEERFLQGGCMKLCYILARASDMDWLRASCARFASGSLVNHAGSSPVFYEVTGSTVSKAAGIAAARAWAGASERVLVCIGDYYNDEAMLRGADIAACPADSPQDIKDICSLICRDNNYGAVGDLIQKLYKL